MKPNLKPRHLLLGGLLAATVGAIMLEKGEPEVVGAVERSASTDSGRGASTPEDEHGTRTATTARAATREPDIALVRDRAELIGSNDADNASVTPLFASHSWTPPPPPPPPVVVAPPPKPTAPPLPFTYIGKKEENGKWEAYLARNGETYVVREQSVIDGIYRADAITPNMLTMTYLPLKQVQRLAIGGE